MAVRLNKLKNLHIHSNKKQIRDFATGHYQSNQKYQLIVYKFFLQNREVNKDKKNSDN